MGDGMEQRKELLKSSSGQELPGDKDHARAGTNARFFPAVPGGRIMRYGKTDLSPITAMK